MPQAITRVSVLVRDYDAAIDFYTKALGFELVEDTPLEKGKRWVIVAPTGSRETAVLLARAATPDQERAVGNQTGGRVFLVLHTDDFWRDYDAMKRRGVAFTEKPREEAYGTVAVFKDLYGNKWDLIQPQKSDAADSH